MRDRGTRVRNIDRVLDRLLVEGVFDWEGPNMRSAVRKLDLLHLCFSLNFYFLMFLSQFPSMFPLLTYSQSFFSLPADYSRHSR